MMVSALLVPVSVLVLPFFGVLGPALAAYAATAALIGEVVFWLGAGLAGRDTWKILRSYGWRELPGRVTDVLRTGELALVERQAV
jgi:dihydrofolate reductase